MRDLIVKQTASLATSGSSVAMHNPDLLRSPGANQEVLGAEDKGDGSVAILKTILSTLKKSLVAQEETQSSVERLVKVSSPEEARELRSLQEKQLTVLDDIFNSLNKGDKTTGKPVAETSMIGQLLKGLGRAISGLAGISALAKKLGMPFPDIGKAAKGAPDKKGRTADRVSKDGEDGKAGKASKDGKDGKASKDGKAGKAGKAADAVPKGALGKMIPNLLKGFLKVGLVGIVASLFSGIVDGIKEYAKSGDIMKALTAGLGGFLEFLTFGLFDKEDVEKWLKGAKEIWNNLGTYVDEYLVQPFNKIVDTVGKALDEYIVQPVSNFIGTVSELFKQYVMDPIAGFLESVTGVFTSITDSLMAFLTNFEIPKVSVTLPVVGEISAGPWKPFAGIASAIGGGGGGTAAPSAPPATSGNAVVASSAANDGARDNLAASSAPVIISAPSTNVQNSQNISIPQPVRNPDRSFTNYAGRNRVIA